MAMVIGSCRSRTSCVSFRAWPRGGIEDGLILRVDRAAATQFSFFLAVPTMLGEAVYDLWKYLSVENGTMIAIG